MTNRQLHNRVNKIKELEKQADELKKQIDALKNEIKDYMDAEQVEELQLSDYTVRYKEVATNRFDTTTFKKAYTNLYNQFIKTSTSKRFTIA